MGIGTFQKAKKIKLRHANHYMEERTAFEFGWLFETLPASRVRWGDAISEPDSPSITETIWHSNRYINFLNPFPEDKFELKSIEATYEGEVSKSGIGLIIRETSAQWIGNDKLIFAIITQWDPIKKTYLPAENPC